MISDERAKIIMEISRVAAKKAIKRSGLANMLPSDFYRDVQGRTICKVLPYENKGVHPDFDLYYKIALCALFFYVGQSRTGAGKPTQNGKFNGFLGQIELDPHSPELTYQHDTLPFQAIAKVRLSRLWLNLTPIQRLALVDWFHEKPATNAEHSRRHSNLIRVAEKAREDGSPNAIFFAANRPSRKGPSSLSFVLGRDGLSATLLRARRKAGSDMDLRRVHP